jgi:hypothetical protein
MNADERELLDGLQALSSDAPYQAPAYVEDRLLTEFRRRTRLRRARAWMSAVSVGAVAATIAVLLWIGPLAPRHAASPADATAMADETTAGFYPLPDAEGLPPVESAMVVRVQMPMASLELIGFPINLDRASDRVEAEVLLGQDGLARGVRLVE